MNNLSRLLSGPDIYIKRDDVTEIAGGGNKTRKLEYALHNCRGPFITSGMVLLGRKL